MSERTSYLILLIGALLLLLGQVGMPSLTGVLLLSAACVLTWRLGVVLAPPESEIEFPMVNLLDKEA